MFDGRPPGYVFDGVDSFDNAGTGKSLLLKQEIATADRPEAYAIVDDPLGQMPHQVWRMTAEYPRDYLPETAKARCELQPNPTTDFLAVGIEFWCLFTTMFPGSWIFPASTDPFGAQLVVCEWHGQPQDPPRVAPWDILMRGDRLELYRANDDTGQQVDYYTSRWRSRPLQRNHWYSFVIHGSWSAEAEDGCMEVWVDRRLITRETGLDNTYPWMEYMYPKNGMYANGGWPANWGGSATAYWGGFVVADGTSASFNEFMAECGYPELTELERVSGPVCAGVF